MNVQSQIQVAQSLQKSLGREIQASSKSMFDLHPYSPYENVWQKIMDIKQTSKNNNNKNR